MEEILMEVLTETLNISPEELSSTLKDENGEVKEGAKSEILTKVSNHIAAVKSAGKEEGKGWGTREALKTFESELVAEMEYDNTNNLKGLGLVRAIIDSKTSILDETYKGRIKELEDSKGFTDEDVKKSQLYIDLEAALATSKEEKEEAVKKAVETLQKEMQSKELFSSVVEQGLTYLDGVNPILSEDPVKKKAQIDALFISKLSDFGYQKHENGIFVLDKETGNRIENSLGHALKLDELFKQVAEKGFDFKASTKKDFKSKNGENGESIALPKTEKELFDFLGDKTKPIDERNKVEQLWKSGQLELDG